MCAGDTGKEKKFINIGEATGYIAALSIAAYIASYVFHLTRSMVLGFPAELISVSILDIPPSFVILFIAMLFEAPWLIARYRLFHIFQTKGQSGQVTAAKETDVLAVLFSPLIGLLFSLGLLCLNLLVQENSEIATLLPGICTFIGAIAILQVLATLLSRWPVVNSLGFLSTLSVTGAVGVIGSVNIIPIISSLVLPLFFQYISLRKTQDFIQSDQNGSEDAIKKHYSSSSRYMSISFISFTCILVLIAYRLNNSGLSVYQAFKIVLTVSIFASVLVLLFFDSSIKGGHVELIQEKAHELKSFFRKSLVSVVVVLIILMFVVEVLFGYTTSISTPLPKLHDIRNAEVLDISEGNRVIIRMHDNKTEYGVVYLSDGHRIQFN